MIKKIFTLLLFIILGSCVIQQKSIPNLNQKKHVDLTKEKDTTEYKLIVFDVGYQNFLLSKAMPKEYYSMSYYKNRNTLYVQEWNRRVRSQPVNGGFYQQEINYSQFQDYGLDLEYQLFNYFQFLEIERGFNFGLRRF